MSIFTPPLTPRPTHPTAKDEQKHVRRTVVDYDRIGIPIACHATCSCGWTQRDIADSDRVDRLLHQHLIDAVKR